MMRTVFFKKALAVAASAILASAFLTVKADEGMWLPSLISQRIGDMQAKGFRLSAEDIYSINQASGRFLGNGKERRASESGT